MDVLRIGSRTYRRSPTVDRFQVRLDELGDLRMTDIPPHSHLEVLGMPVPPPDIESEMWLVNAGDQGSDEFLAVYGGASIPVTPSTAQWAVSRLRRAFPPKYSYGHRHNPDIKVENFANRGYKAHVFLNLEFRGQGKTLVRDAIQPFLAGFRRLSTPDLHVFLCHASEDKSFVRALAERLSDAGAGVWLDDLEIKVGDSIVEKIGAGIETATHLILVLSRASVNKPWVTREFSSALMRQLNSKSISVLPVRLDDAAIPALLADIRYADCRANWEVGLTDLLDSLHATNDA